MMGIMWIILHIVLLGPQSAEATQMAMKTPTMVLGKEAGSRDNIFDEQWGQADDLERKPINFSWIDHRGRSFEELRKEHERFTNVNKSVVQHTSHTQRRQRGNACDHWWPLYDCFVSGYAPSSCQKRFHYALSIAILGSDLSDTALCFLMI